MQNLRTPRARRTLKPENGSSRQKLRSSMFSARGRFHTPRARSVNLASRPWRTFVSHSRRTRARRRALRSGSYAPGNRSLPCPSPQKIRGDRTCPPGSRRRPRPAWPDRRTPILRRIENRPPPYSTAEAASVQVPEWPNRQPRRRSQAPECVCPARSSPLRSRRLSSR